MASTNGADRRPEKPRCAPAIRVSKVAGMKRLTDRFPQLALSPASIYNPFLSVSGTLYRLFCRIPACSRRFQLPCVGSRLLSSSNWPPGRRWTKNRSFGPGSLCTLLNWSSEQNTSILQGFNAL